MEDTHFYKPTGIMLALIALLTGCYGGEPVIPEAPDPGEWAAYALRDAGGDGEGDGEVELVDMEPLTDASISGTCSVIGGPGMQWTVTNSRAIPVKLWWVDFECVERPYADILPGATLNQMSFVDHVWRIRDVQSGQLVAEVVLEGDGQMTEVR